MKKIFDMTPRNRLIIAVTVILFFSFIGLSLFNFAITRESVHKEILENDLPLTRDNIYSELISELRKPIFVASSMSNDTFLKDWAMSGERDLSKITSYLLEIKNKYGFFSAFFVSSKTGKYYHFKGVHKCISRADEHDVWYYHFIDSGLEYDLDVDTDEASGNVLSIFINFRIEDHRGKLIGVCGVGMKMQKIAELISRYQEKYNRTIFMVDRKGVVQVHTDSSLIEKVSLAKMAGVSAYEKDILKVDNDLGNYSFTRNSRDIILTTRYISDIDWFLIVEQDETSSLATARQNFINTVFVGFASSLLIIILTVLTVNRYQRKVEAMSRIDMLTGLANRRELVEAFCRVRNTIGRHERSFCILLMDLDNFKQVNDRMGHLEGDRVLKEISALVKSVIRPEDLLVRWGGDEFIILSENRTDSAISMAERIREIIEEKNLPFNTQPGQKKVTVSCGVVVIQNNETLDDAVSRADILMYRCKAEGGNMVVNDDIN